MNININAKNYKTNDYLEETIQKKMEKLGKYFADDITVNVMLSKERDKDKIEATINAKGAVFRSEERADDIYDAIEKVVDRLKSQMEKFKGKLQKRYRSNESIKFESFQDSSNHIEETKVSKSKKVKVTPMTVDEAILEMEMIQHDFYVFTNIATDAVSIVYRRKSEDYGVLETII